MSYLKSPPADHLILLDKISQELTNDRDAPRFKNRLGQWLRPGEVERSSVLELLRKLDRRRVIATGQYRELIRVLVDIERVDLVQRFFPLEKVPDAEVHRQPPACPLSVDSVVTDEDMYWLAESMGPEWESFGVRELGVTRNQIFQCQAEKPYSPLSEHIFSMLSKWRDRKGSEATYKNLMGKLEAFEEFDKDILDEWKTKRLF